MSETSSAERIADWDRLMQSGLTRSVETLEPRTIYVVVTSTPSGGIQLDYKVRPFTLRASHAHRSSDDVNPEGNQCYAVTRLYTARRNVPVRRHNGIGHTARPVRHCVHRTVEVPAHELAQHLVGSSAEAPRAIIRLADFASMVQR